MDQERNFWVVGGDLRQRALARLLREDGHTVHVAALEGEGLAAEPLGPGLALAHCVILPLPVTRQGELLHTPLSREEVTLPQLLDWLEPGQVLCGGLVSAQAEEAAQARGLRLLDYYAREECMVANAVPTAEGAVQVAMEELPFTLHSARVLVLGFGRVGRMTAQRFHALGARVTAAARRYEQLAWARAMGLDAQRLEELAGWLCGYDLIVNTVPARVLGRRELEDTRADCLILDLASKPGGVDLSAAADLGRTVIWALSLPGKVAPVTAGAAIQTAIYNMLQELGY